MEYKGIIKERALWLKVAVIIASGFCMYLSIVSRQYVYLLLTLLVIAACFFEKEHVISEKGVDIKYIMFKSIVRHNYWTWNEVTTIHFDYIKARPNVMVHIGKDVMVRTFVMKPSDCDGIANLAREMNSGIYIKE